MSADRSESAEADSFAASFAVLLFEPQTALPPSDAATAAAITAGSKRIAPKSIAASTSVPPATATCEAKINLRQLSIFEASSSMRSSRRATSLCGSLIWSPSKVQCSRATNAPLTLQCFARATTWTSGSDGRCQKPREWSLLGCVLAEREGLYTLGSKSKTNAHSIEIYYVASYVAND